MHAHAVICYPILQPFSQTSLSATVPKVFQIGLCGVVVADLERFCNSGSVGFWGERLYSRSPKNPALQLFQTSSKSASTTPQGSIWNTFATVAVRDFWGNGCNC